MNKIILLTGASTGFGRLTAEKLHKAGYKVYGTSRKPEAHQTDFELLKMDVTDEASIIQAVSHIISTSGQIDVLINNAGILIYGPIEEHTDDDVAKIMNTNFLGAHKVLRHVLPHMRKARSGRVINVTSLAGLVGTPLSGVYSATKHALEGYTKSLSYELEQFNIEVVLVKPGEFKTEIFDNALETSIKISDYDNLKNTIPDIITTGPNGAPSPQPVADLLFKTATMSKPKLNYRIGAFANAIPILQLFPSLLKKITKKAFKL
jgi:NAD(P)-dependent dehydrogenase (short-subunit alcohol dehydrogenase family)